jgi:hypothetical protein
MPGTPDQQPVQTKANDILKERSVPDDKPLDLNQLVFKSMPKGLSATRNYVTPPVGISVASGAPVSALGEMTGTAAHQQAKVSATESAVPPDSLMSNIPLQAAPSSNKNLWIAIIAIVILFAAGAGVYLFVFKKPAATSSQTSQTLTPANATTDATDTTPATTNTPTSTPTTPSQGTGTMPTTPTTSASTSVLTAAWLMQYFPTEAPNGVCSATEQTVCGDAADPDADGLTNAQEFKIGTNPTLADTDQDGIADGDEVNVFDINPLSAHTAGVAKYTDSGDLTHMYNSTAKAPFTSIDMTRIASAIKEYGLHAPTTSTLSQATIESYTNYTAPASAN